MHLGITPPQLLFLGAGVMLAGFVLAAFVDPLIWVAFAGVVLFIVGFAWSFFRRPSAGGAAPGQRQTVWRGRTISYDPEPKSGSLRRIRRLFRKDR